MGGVSIVHVADVVDDWLDKRIRRACREASVDLRVHETPQFLTTDKEIRAYFGSSPRHLQHSFYVWQRKRLNVLVEEGKPVGGSWSFDKDNRKRLPKGLELPSEPSPERNEWIDEAMRYVEKNFPHHYGSLESFSYAVTHEGARTRLDQFLRERFENFGAYEDALSTRGYALFHSVLSPYLNNGLLTPREVLDAVLEYASHHEVPLPSLEGFVRQLIGWREFVRMIYVCGGGAMRRKNALAAQRSLTESWWTGDTGIVPLDHAIDTLKRHAYTHHIVRLMVAGNLMTLLGARPDDCYRWFMEWYIDAYDWVMVPNVYGMALFADGGSMTTKPYVSSSRYISNMSDYPPGPWKDIWDALYWSFVDRHRSVLSSGHRSSFSVIQFDRLSEGKKEHYRTAASQAIERLTDK